MTKPPTLKPSRSTLAAVANEHTKGLLSHQQAIAHLQRRCAELEDWHKRFMGMRLRQRLRWLLTGQ